MPLYFFGSESTITVVVLVSSFVMVSTVWSVSCLLLFYSECPRAQSLVQVGGGAVPDGVTATAHVC